MAVSPATPPGATRNAGMAGARARTRAAGVGHVLMDIPGGELGLIYRPIRGQLSRTEDILRETARKSRHLVSNMAGYLLGRPGKRIRGALVLFSARAGRADPRKAAHLAAVVEMLHLASLIHDDILDGADWRRGRHALHAIWGTRPSILMGDFLFSRIVNILTAEFPVRVLSPIMRAAEEMCDGEIEEEAVAWNTRVGKSRYFRILRKKTAGLMGSACEAAAVLAGAREPVVKNLRDFGMNFGMGFQLADDALNFSATEHAMGKPVRSDIAEGRFTYPILCLRDRTHGRGRAGILRLLTRSSLSNGGVARVAELVSKSGCIPSTLEAAAGYFAKARRALIGVPAAAAAPLAALASFAAGQGERGR